MLQNGSRGYGVPLSLCTLCPPPGNWNYGSQCQSSVKRKGTIYSKVIQIQSNGGMSSLKTSKSLTTPPNTHSPSFPLLSSQANPGVPYLRKKIGVWLSQLPVIPSNPCSTWQASHSPQHRQLCRHCNLQFLLQNHVAPSHGPPARVLPPFPSCSVSPAFFQTAKRELCMASTSCFPAS